MAPCRTGDGSGESSVHCSIIPVPYCICRVGPFSSGSMLGVVWMIVGQGAGSGRWRLDAFGCVWVVPGLLAMAADGHG